MSGAVASYCTAGFSTETWKYRQRPQTNLVQIRSHANMWLYDSRRSAAILRIRRSVLRISALSATTRAVLSSIPLVMEFLGAGRAQARRLNDARCQT